MLNCSIFSSPIWMTIHSLFKIKEVSPALSVMVFCALQLHIQQMNSNVYAIFNCHCRPVPIIIPESIPVINLLLIINFSNVMI